MNAVATFDFPPFRLDLGRALLYRDGAVVTLRRKTYALLTQLVTHAGAVLGKAELLDSVWPDRVISEGGLSELVRELRSILGDDARRPRYIETVHGRGYRFIAALALAAPTGQPLAPADLVAASSARGDRPADVAAGVPGRDGELAQLCALHARAQAGERQLVFVTGEPGIGKSALLAAFRASLEPDEPGTTAPLPQRVTLGQCIEQYGAGEAYLPILDALGRLARQGDQVRLLATLRRHAPTWLAQLPSLLEPAEHRELEQRAAGSTRSRMMREMAEALEVLTADVPLLLLLEDLHWSDYSTVDLLAFIAQRREPARLMIVGTYRPVDVLSSDHPLRAAKEELEQRSRCVEMPLPCLGVSAVGAYLARRFGDRMPAAVPLPALADLVHRRTDGHPLFMVNVADYVDAIDFAALPDSVECSIPHGVRQMIEKQVARLDAETLALLETAAVAGTEFAVASLAAGLGLDDADALEARCAGLARRAQFLGPLGETRWPDGTLSARFGFLHALYQNVLYHRVPAGRRARLHLRIGLAEERAFGVHAGDIAHELALHFEKGQDAARAIEYLCRAGERATARCAHREAIAAFDHARALLSAIEGQDARDRLELALAVALGPALVHSRGYAATIVGEVYGRARELHAAVGAPDQLFPVLWGLWLYHVVRGEHRAAHAIGVALCDHERATGTTFPWAHYALGCSLFWMGDLAAACGELDRAIADYDGTVHAAQIGRYSQDPRAVSLLYRAWALWILGRPEQAQASADAAVTHARVLQHPFTLAFAHDYAGELARLRRVPAGVAAHAAEAGELCTAHGFPFWHAWAETLRGWASCTGGAVAEGLAAVRAGRAAYAATDASMAETLFHGLEAEVCLAARDAPAAARAVAAGLTFASSSGERAYRPELLRLAGEALLLGGDAPDGGTRAGFVALEAALPAGCASTDGDPVARATWCFERAIEEAAEMGARGWALRTAPALARCYLAAGREDTARAVLLRWMADGAERGDGVDAREARAVLDGLSR